MMVLFIFIQIRLGLTFLWILILMSIDDHDGFFSSRMRMRLDGVMCYSCPLINALTLYALNWKNRILLSQSLISARFVVLIIGKNCIGACEPNLTTFSEFLWPFLISYELFKLPVQCSPYPIFGLTKFIIEVLDIFVIRIFQKYFNVLCNTYIGLYMILALLPD